MPNDDRWDDNAMSEDDSYMNDESYDQDNGQGGWHDQAQGDHYDAAMAQAEEDQHGAALGDLAPRESRKERRRRLAMEAQAQAEQEHLQQPHQPQAHEDHGHAEADAMQGQEPVAAPKAGKFGFLKKFGKRNRPEAVAAEAAAGEEMHAAGQPVQITLPVAALIDPNMLTEYGIDPNTLASMGLDPSTLPQFDADFLTELGINPNIVIDILHRMIAAEGKGGGVEAGVGHARPKWAGRMAVIKRWAPAAAAVTGLTATGAIWFMAGGDDAKEVPTVKAEQLAGEEAEAKIKAQMADAETGEKPPVEEPAQADAPPVAAAVLPPGESLKETVNEPPGGLAEPPKSDPVQLAAATPPGLPGESAPPPADLPMSTGEPGPPAGAQKEEPPMASLPALPGMSDAPPLPPGPADAPPLPVEAAKPPLGEAPPSAGEKSAISKDLPPAAAGLGVAALAADQLANHAKDGAEAAPKDAPPLPAAAPKGMEAPADLPPLGGNPAIKPELPAAEPPKMAEPPKVEPPAEAPKSLDPPGLPPIGANSDTKKTEPPEADTKNKAVAGLAGLAAGLGIGKAADAIKKGGEEHKPEMASSAPVAPELPKPGNDLPPAPPTTDLKSAPAVAADAKPADLPPLGSVPEPNKPALPATSVADGGVQDHMKPEVAAAKPTGDSAAAKAGLTEAKADWPTIPNGRGRLLRSVVTSGSDTTRAVASATAGLGAGMMIAQAGNDSRRSSAVQDLGTPSTAQGTAEIAPITHVVESGENFWTISRDYYGSGRYYKALWAANRKAVPKIDQLHVGDSIRIPAMEYLDKSLIQPPTVAKSKRGTSESNPPEVARSLDNRAVRTGNDIESTPVGSMQNSPVKAPAAPRSTAPENDKEIISQPVGETTAKGSMMRHRVMPGETIRTIARDRLGDARRDDDIVALNSDIIDNVRSPLQAGMVLKLPPGSKGD